MNRRDRRRPFHTPAEAATFAIARALDDANMALWESALRRANANHPVSLAVDVGCGTGHFLTTIRKSTGARVIGIDLSMAMLREAHTGARKGFPLVCADGVRLPIQSEAADLLFYSMVFHHLDHVEDALSEARRCLRKGGQICIRTSTVDRLACFAYLRYFPSAMKIDKSKMPSVKALVGALEGAQLRVVRNEVVVQRAEVSVAEYVEFVRTRSLSDLLAITDEEFTNGLAQLVADVERGVDVELSEPMDFIVARRV